MGALHTVDNVEIHWVFQSRYLVGFDFAFVGVGFFMKNVGDGFHHHEVVITPKFSKIGKNRVGDLGGVDGENHAVVNRILVIIKHFGVVVLAVFHHAVDDTMRRILAGFEHNFQQLITDWRQIYLNT